MTLAREMALESEYVMGTFARKPVEFVEGHGMTLIDDAGNPGPSWNLSLIHI